MLCFKPAVHPFVLQISNLLSDGIPPFVGGTNGVTNGSTWTVDGSSVATGLSLPIKPAAGDLLGTTITNIGPAGKFVQNTWSGQDRGYSLSGYANNAVVGRLILDSKGELPRERSSILRVPTSVLPMHCMSTILSCGITPPITETRSSAM